MDTAAEGLGDLSQRNHLFSVQFFALHSVWPSGNANMWHVERHIIVTVDLDGSRIHIFASSFKPGGQCLFVSNFEGGCNCLCLFYFSVIESITNDTPTSDDGRILSSRISFQFLVCVYDT